ncbi:MAG: hypothetical protein HYV07_19020 [Deltaproteobacteria bacterium]|nr:hypothetical protein [Deltaproteobacteria bacterium]
MNSVTFRTVLALFALGCEEDVTSKPRADSGVLAADAGGGPLLLEAGMSLAYSGQLHFRAGGDEKDAAFTLELTIRSADDQGPSASRATVTATGERTFANRFDATAGFDSWVARLGPVDATEIVLATPVTVELSDAPEMPPFPKSLPFAQMFFLDLRASAELRSAFVSEHEALGPSAIDPSNHPVGRWALGLDGVDPDLVYYDPGANLRHLSLEYDPRGFLEVAEERLGDADNHPNLPNGAFTLRRTGGP